MEGWRGERVQSPKAEPSPVLFECLSSPMEAAGEKKDWFKVYLRVPLLIKVNFLVLSCFLFTCPLLFCLRSFMSANRVSAFEVVW